MLGGGVSLICGTWDNRKDYRSQEVAARILFILQNQSDYRRHTMSLTNTLNLVEIYTKLLYISLVFIIKINIKFNKTYVILY